MRFNASLMVLASIFAISSQSAANNSKKNQPPVANLTLTQPDALNPHKIHLSSAGSSDSDGTIKTVVFKLPDKKTVTATQHDFVVPTDGAFSFTVEVTDNKGAKSKVTKTIEIDSLSTLAPVKTVYSEILPAGRGGDQFFRRNFSVSSADTNRVYLLTLSLVDPSPTTLPKFCLKFPLKVEKCNAIISRLTGLWAFNFVLNDHKLAKARNVDLEDGPFTAVVNLKTLNKIEARVKGLGVGLKAEIQQLGPKGRPPVVDMIFSSYGNIPKTLAVGPVVSDPDGGPLTYHYDFGNGETADFDSAVAPVTTYSAFGDYTVSLTVTDSTGLSTTATKTFKAVANSTPYIMATASPSSGSTPLTVQFSSAGSYDSDGDEIVRYRWSFEDGTSSALASPTKTFTAVGRHQVDLAVWDARTGVSSKRLFVYVSRTLAPIAAFTMTPGQGAAPFTTTFDASSSRDQDLNSEVTRAVWNFGDFTPEVEGISVQHTYPRAGRYFATLTVFDADGDASVATRVIDVIQAAPPVAIAGVDKTSGIAPETFYFNAMGSYDPDGQGIADYNWNFSDGTTATGLQVEKTFATPGQYTASLRVTDGVGLVSVPALQVVNVVANQLPVSSFQVIDTPGSRSLKTLDGSLSSDVDGTIVRYTWVLPNNQLIPGKVITYDFPAGTSVVYLSIADNKGGTRFSHQLVTVVPNSPPSAVLVVNDVPGSRVVKFFDSTQSLDSDGTIDVVGWGVNGSVVSWEPTLFYTFPNPGTYTVLMYLEDNEGESVLVERQVSIPPPQVPQAQIEVFDNPISRFQKRLDGSRSADGDGTIEYYLWNVDNLEFFVGPVWDYEFQAPGTYNVGLYIEDNEGISHFVNRQITIGANLPPVAAFSFSNSETNSRSISFDASQSRDDLGIARYDWSFGDGTVGSGQLANHEYSSDGVYEVSLTVTDVDGSSRSRTLSVAAGDNVFLPLKFSATQTNGDLSLAVVQNETLHLSRYPASVSFSINPDEIPSGGFQVLWDFGDGSLASEQNPTHHFRRPGDFEVKVTLISGNETRQGRLKVAVAETGCGNEEFPLCITGAFGNQTIGSSTTLVLNNVAAKPLDPSAIGHSLVVIDANDKRFDVTSSSTITSHSIMVAGPSLDAILAGARSPLQLELKTYDVDGESISGIVPYLVHPIGSARYLVPDSSYVRLVHADTATEFGMLSSNGIVEFHYLPKGDYRATIFTNSGQDEFSWSISSVDDLQGELRKRTSSNSMRSARVTLSAEEQKALEEMQSRLESPNAQESGTRSLLATQAMPTCTNCWIAWFEAPTYTYIHQTAPNPTLDIGEPIGKSVGNQMSSFASYTIPPESALYNYANYFVESDGTFSFYCKAYSASWATNHYSWVGSLNQIAETNELLARQLRQQMTDMLRESSDTHTAEQKVCNDYRSDDPRYSQCLEDNYQSGVRFGQRNDAITGEMQPKISAASTKYQNAFNQVYGSRLQWMVAKGTSEASYSVYVETVDAEGKLTAKRLAGAFGSSSMKGKFRRFGNEHRPDYSGIANYEDGAVARPFKISNLTPGSKARVRIVSDYRSAELFPGYFANNKAGCFTGKKSGVFITDFVPAVPVLESSDQQFLGLANILYSNSVKYLSNATSETANSKNRTSGRSVFGTSVDTPAILTTFPNPHYNTYSSFLLPPFALSRDFYSRAYDLSMQLKVSHTESVKEISGVNLHFEDSLGEDERIQTITFESPIVVTGNTTLLPTAIFAHQAVRTELERRNYAAYNPQAPNEFNLGFSVNFLDSNGVANTSAVRVIPTSPMWNAREFWPDGRPENTFLYGNTVSAYVRSQLSAYLFHRIETEGAVSGPLEINDGSLPFGGEMHPHKAHNDGNVLDIRPFGLRDEVLSLSSNGYDYGDKTNDRYNDTTTLIDFLGSLRNPSTGLRLSSKKACEKAPGSVSCSSGVTKDQCLNDFTYATPDERTRLALGGCVDLSPLELGARTRLERWTILNREGLDLARQFDDSLKFIFAGGQNRHNRIHADINRGRPFADRVFFDPVIVENTHIGYQRGLLQYGMLPDGTQVGTLKEVPLPNLVWTDDDVHHSHYHLRGAK